VVINGAFGLCHPLNKHKPFVAEKVMGKGKTNSWYLGSLDPQRTITILYETKEAETKERTYYFQLKTTFRNDAGKVITRVTTVERTWSSQVHEIAQGFNSEAAIVYLARYCVHKALIEEQQNLRQWLDSSLCKWASYFAQFVKNDLHSFSLPEKMRRFPQSMYHLRRSNFVNRFGLSLDEVTLL
jgi:protein transport protein SEC23